MIESIASDKPTRNTGVERVRLGVWIVVTLAGTFTLARFSEAFLLLRAQSVGMALALVPIILVAMNVVYGLAAWPVNPARADFCWRRGRYCRHTVGQAR